MNLNRIELKKTMYDFNRTSNRLLQADFRDYADVLSKFISFIREHEIILDYVSSCGECDQNIEQEVRKVFSSYGRDIFTLGNSEIEEVRNIYAILSYIANKKFLIHYQIGIGYSRSRNYQDVIKGFNDRFVMVLIRHIEGYLTKVGIEMGLDDKAMFSITTNGPNAQVNIANDNSILHATMHNGVDTAQLLALIEGVKQKVEALSDDDKETVSNCLDVINQELRTEKPRKSFLKSAISGISAVKGTAEFMAAVAALIQFLQTILAK